MASHTSAQRPMLVASTAIIAAVPLVVFITAQFARSPLALGPWYAYFWLWVPIGLAWAWALTGLPGMAWVELLAFFGVCAIGLHVTRLGSDVEAAVGIGGLFILPVVGVFYRKWAVVAAGAALGLGYAVVWLYSVAVVHGGPVAAAAPGVAFVYAVLFTEFGLMDGLIAYQLAHREQALRSASGRAEESERRYRLLADHATDLIALHDADGTITYVSPSWEGRLGYPPADLIGRSPFAICHPDDVRHLDACLAAARSSHTAHVAARLLTQSGDSRWFDIEVHAYSDPGDGSVRLQSASRDITERKAFEEQLAHQAFHDSLTALPNRALFSERVRHAMGRGRRRAPVAVLMLDVDNFKRINDSLGPTAGDRLLVALAARIQALLRHEDTLARLGGDEFGILIEHARSADDPVQLATRVQRALQEPFTLDAGEIFASASIGIATASDHASADDLLRDADAAVYAAKSRGKAQHRVFERTMNADAAARLQLEGDLRHAVAREELVLHFQPIVDLTTGNLAGFEALVRWRHPERGLLSPAAFVPMAEESGLIVSIGQWVMTQACRQARAWQDLLPAAQPLLMSINISALQLQLPDFADHVRLALAETGADPRSLQFEITESALLADEAATIRVMHWLRELGIKLALDDFGIGYSSMAYLKSFPVDVLKIDRSFISRLGDDPEDTAIVRSLIALGKSLKLRVSSEGVETREQLEHLRSHDCEHAQGYLFARPMPLDAAQNYIQQAQRTFGPIWQNTDAASSDAGAED